ncbi:hypothetical protein MKEN_01410700 [Mycena kentingensis (nom. inval.)]|nr:hypothetical protein MKEN_01410700 [Mycena kentingensis (nom. inval.)]
MSAPDISSPPLPSGSTPTMRSQAKTPRPHTYKKWSPEAVKTMRGASPALLVILQPVYRAFFAARDASWLSSPPINTFAALLIYLPHAAVFDKTPNPDTQQYDDLFNKLRLLPGEADVKKDKMYGWFGGARKKAGKVKAVKAEPPDPRYPSFDLSVLTDLRHAWDLVPSPHDRRSLYQYWIEHAYKARGAQEADVVSWIADQERAAALDVPSSPSPAPGAPDDDSSDDDVPLAQQQRERRRSSAIYSPIKDDDDENDAMDVDETQPGLSRAQYLPPTPTSTRAPSLPYLKSEPEPERIPVRSRFPSPPSSHRHSQRARLFDNVVVVSTLVARFRRDRLSRVELYSPITPKSSLPPTETVTTTYTFTRTTTYAPAGSIAETTPPPDPQPPRMPLPRRSPQKALRLVVDYNDTPTVADTLLIVVNHVSGLRAAIADATKDGPRQHPESVKTLVDFDAFMDGLTAQMFETLQAFQQRIGG